MEISNHTSRCLLRLRFIHDRQPPQSPAAVSILTKHSHAPAFMTIQHAVLQVVGGPVCHSVASGAWSDGSGELPHSLQCVYLLIHCRSQVRKVTHISAFSACRVASGQHFIAFQMATSHSSSQSASSFTTAPLPAHLHRQPPAGDTITAPDSPETKLCTPPGPLLQSYSIRCVALVGFSLVANVRRHHSRCS